MRHLILLLIIIARLSGFAQQNDISQLYIELSATTNVIQKIDILNNFVDTLCLHKNETGQKIAFTALALSKANNYSTGISEAAHSIGLTHFRRNNDSALYYFHLSRKFFSKKNTGFHQFAFALNNLSRTHLELLQYDSAIFWAKQALQFVNENSTDIITKTRWLMYSNGALANAFADKSMYDSASVYYFQSVRFAEKINDNKMLGVYLRYLSQVQAGINNYSKAIEVGKKAAAYLKYDDRLLTFLYTDLASYNFQAGRMNEAKQYADSSIALGKISNVYNVIGRNYIILGNIQKENRQFDHARQYYQEGLTLSEKHHNSKSAIRNLYRKLGEIYEHSDSFELAEQYFTKGLKLADTDDEFKAETSLLLSKLEYKRENYLKAYNHLVEFQRFNDAYLNKENIKSIQEINARYDIEKKDQQLLLLSKDQQLQKEMLNRQYQQIEKDASIKREQQLSLKNIQLENEQIFQLSKVQSLALENAAIKQKNQQSDLQTAQAKIQLQNSEKELMIATVRNQRNWFLYLLSFVIIAGIIGWLLFNRFKLLKKIQNQHDLISQRQRISRDLHDEVGATLSGICMYSHILKDQIQSGEQSKYESTLHLIRENSVEMVEKLNDIVWLTNPDKDNLEQLMLRLHDYIHKLGEAQNIKIESVIDKSLHSVSINEDDRKNIYLFCKEAIANSIKHSKATKLLFKAEIRDKQIEIMLKDNGDGFDINDTIHGNGISNLKERARILDALLRINSEPGKGTTVELLIPV